MPERTEEERKKFERFQKMCRIHLTISDLIYATGFLLITVFDETAGLGLILLGTIAQRHYYKMREKGRNQYNGTDK